MDRLRLKISLLSRPGNLFPYLVLGILTQDKNLYGRAITFFGNIFEKMTIHQINVLKRHATPNISRDIFEKQFIFSPKAIIFMPADYVQHDKKKHLAPLFTIPHAADYSLQTTKTTHRRVAQKILERYTNVDILSKNTTVVILSKSLDSVNMELISCYQRPLICCWAEACGREEGSFEDSENIRFFFGHEDPILRLKSALSFVDTDYIISIGDDDFVFERFLRKGELFLEANPAFSGVCGIGTDVRFNEVSSHLSFFRLSEHHLPVPDVSERLSEWALFGGITFNSLFRRDQVDRVLNFMPDRRFSNSVEYYYDICITLLGMSYRVPEPSIVRRRDRDSATYVSPPPILETTRYSINSLFEISSSVKAFLKDLPLRVSEEDVEWAVAYGSSRRFIENSAFNKGLSTLPKALRLSSQDILFDRTTTDAMKKIGVVGSLLF